MKLPRKPPDISGMFKSPSVERLPAILEAVREPTYKGKYLHWDEVWNRGAPAGLTNEEWWVGLKFNRMPTFRQIPLKDVKGRPFQFAVPEEAERLLHDVTQRAGGSVGAFDQVTNPERRHRYLSRNLIEEGITSSLLEGASTTRQKAKELIRSKRSPIDEAGHMVLNNYRAMQHIIDLGRVALTPELVFELHEIITRNTLKNPNAAGRLRRSDEPIRVVDQRDNTELHVPPPAGELRKRLSAMCRFANGDTPNGFVHPVVRSILLHFWLAYDHPFVDGNGRCARALFYWSMLQHDYWLCQFFSISKIILSAPIQYGQAFLYTETDGNDLTYFLLHQLNVVKRAIDELHRYLDEKMAQRRHIETQLRLSEAFNERQMDVIAHAIRHPDASYDFRQHENNYSVAYQTARTDLLDLAEYGFLTKYKIGRAFHFRPSGKLDNL